MKLIAVFITIGLTWVLRAQTDLFIHIQPKVGNQNFTVGATVQGIDGTAFKLDYFNYYLSDLLIFHDGGVQTQVNQKVFLFTADQFGFYLGSYPMQTIDSIRFMIGVPSRMNTQAGAEAVDISTYPANNPLSFQSPSMYWGWQFGYMHMIVGGNADSNNDQIPDAYFEMHNLGDHNQRTVNMPIIATQTTATQQDIYLDCNIDQWLRNMPLATVGILHDQTGLNDSVMANINQFNVFTQPAWAAITQIAFPSVNVFEANFSWSNLPHGTLMVNDLSGRNVFNHHWEESNGQVHLDLNTGYYLMTVFDENNALLTSKKYLIVNP